MTDQEVYDLSQTGDEVQNILDKGAALPTNPELQAALSGKQDVITDLSTIRQNAQKGQEAYEQQATVVQQAAQAVEAATDAEHDAQLAQAAALAAAGKLEDLETFLQGLDPESAASVAAELGLFEQEVRENYAKKTECVFDISAYHATGTPPVLAIYANLKAALGTDGENVPEALRTPGMSVKFVQGTEHSSDNKYVQFRYIGTSTANANFINVGNWQGTDKKTSYNSKNLVESGGLDAQFQQIIAQIGEKVNVYTKCRRNASGVIVTSINAWSTSPLLPLSIIEDVSTNGIKVYQGRFIFNGTFPSVMFFDSTETLIADSSIFRDITAGNKVYASEIPNNAVYFAVNCGETDVTLITNFSTDTYFKNLQSRMTAAETNIANVGQRVTNVNKVNDPAFLEIKGSAKRLTTIKSGAEYRSTIYGTFNSGDVVTCEIAGQNIKDNTSIAFISDGFSTNYITYPTVRKDITLTSNATYIQVVILGTNIIADGDILFTVTNNSSSTIKKDVETLKTKVAPLENTVSSIVPLTGKVYSRTDSVSSGTEYRKTITCNFPIGSKLHISILGTGVKYNANASIISDGFGTQYYAYPSSEGVVVLARGCTYVTAVFTASNVIENGSLTLSVKEISGEFNEKFSNISNVLGETLINTVSAKTGNEYSNRIIGDFKAGERLRFIIKASNLNSGSYVQIISTGFSSAQQLRWPNNTVVLTLQNDTTMFRLNANASAIASDGDIEFTVVREGLSTVPLNKVLSRRITIIDDDTLNVSHVQTFRDACVANGIVGTFAVLTEKVYGNSTMTNLLKGYEREGFQMVLHGYSQGNFYRPEAANRNLPDCVEDMARGLQEFKELPYINYDYWVTPFGVVDSDMKSLTKKFGLKCLVSIGQSTTYVGKDYKNYNRYYLPRIGFNAADSESATMQMLKDLIDEASEQGGWVIVGTHMYNGWTQELIATRFKEMVDYAKDKGFTFVTLGQAFEERKYLFDHYDMFGNI